MSITALEVTNHVGGALIGYDNLLVSSATLGANRALIPNTWERYRPEVGTLNVKYQLLSNADVDFIGIAAHGLSGITVLVQTAETVGGALTDVESITFEDNSPVMLTFDTINIAEISLTGTLPADNEIGIVYAGVALKMPQPIYGGVTPINLASMTDYQSPMSESGQFLGRNVIKRGLSGDFNWQHLDDDWIRNVFMSFVESAKTIPFFITWRPDYYSLETVFGYTESDIQPANMGGGTRLMTASMKVKAHSDINVKKKIIEILPSPIEPSILSIWEGGATSQSIDSVNTQLFSSVIFGGSVALAGETKDRCCVGARGTVVNFVASVGEVRIYLRVGAVWSLEQVINNPNPGGDSLSFGRDVQINGDGTRVIISSNDSNESLGGGTTYYYKRTGVNWTLQQTIITQLPGLERTKLSLTDDGVTLFMSIASGESELFSYDQVSDSYLIDIGPITTKKQIRVSNDGMFMISANDSSSTPSGIDVFSKTTGVWLLIQEIPLVERNRFSSIASDYLSISNDGSRFVILNTDSGFIDIYKGGAGSYILDSSFLGLADDLGNYSPVAMSGNGSIIALLADADQTVTIYEDKNDGNGYEQSISFNTTVNTSAAATAIDMTDDGHIILVGQQGYDAPVGGRTEGRIIFYHSIDNPPT